MYKKLVQREKRAFTLVELLVVISIIALLLSILLPSLQQARYQAKRVYCLNNVKSQYLTQVMYAVDNDGKFADHQDHVPWYVRSSNTAGPYPESKIRDSMGSYIGDSRIFLCPMLYKFKYAHADAKWYSNSSIGGSGGWDSDKKAQEAGHEATADMWTSYFWYANYTSADGKEAKFKFRTLDGILVNEKPWPKKLSECAANRAFISHGIYTHAFGGQWAAWDLGHGGVGWYVSNGFPDFSEFSTSIDNPVGYADGHVEARLRRQLKPRAKIPSFSSAHIYY